MTIHVTPPKILGLPGVVALWRQQYPKFAKLMDDGALPAHGLRCLGLALWQDNRLEEAVNVMTASAALAPNEPKMLGEVGSLLCAVGRKVEALRYLTASLEMDMEQTQVWLTVAAICNENGDLETAEHAFRVALELEPQSAEAAAGLGLLFMGRRRFEEAAQLLRDAMERGIDTVSIHACLGQTLFVLGDFAGAAASLGKAAHACPGEGPIVHKYALTRMIESALKGSAKDAETIYLATAGRHAQDTAKTGRTAFQTLCGYGHKDAAIALGEHLTANQPDDPVISYYLDALRGRAPECAPEAYLTTFFDKYAPDFDKHLVEVLNYKVPSLLPPLLAATGNTFARILDLGCGTGLAAPGLSALGGHLTGLDISHGMLEQARELNAYDDLVEDDVLRYLNKSVANFDLIVSLDVLIYFGDLAALFAAVGDRLASGGVFAFSFETIDNADHALQPSGRFAHDPRYVQGLYGETFTCIGAHAMPLRYEANHPVAGQLVLLRRV